jgi:hypothetical protein
MPFEARRRARGAEAGVGPSKNPLWRGARVVIEVFARAPLLLRLFMGRFMPLTPAAPRIPHNSIWQRDRRRLTRTVQEVQWGAGGDSGEAAVQRIQMCQTNH